MDAQERKRIAQLIRVLEHFKESNSTIPLQQVITFLHVARMPGIGVTEVARTSQTHPASSSRHVRALRGQGGAKPALVVAGYGKDERTKPLLLTDEGRCLVNTILAELDPGSFVISAEGGGRRVPMPSGHRGDPRSVTPNRIAWDPFGST